MRSSFSLFAFLLFVSTAHSEVVAKSVEYKHGEVTLEGSIVYDNSVTGKKPGVLVVHEGGGNSTAARSKAAQMVKLGYVAFTADLFGKGVTPKDAKEAAAKAGLIGKDRKQIRERLARALEVFARLPQVNGTIAAVGYGVGGTGVLELARSGIEIEGVVCLHGDLSSPVHAELKKVSASVLIIVGADDPQIPAALASVGIRSRPARVHQCFTALETLASPASEPGPERVATLLRGAWRPAT